MIGGGGGGVLHVAGFWRAGGVGGGGRGIFQAVWVAVLRGTARHKGGFVGGGQLCDYITKQVGF